MQVCGIKFIHSFITITTIYTPNFVIIPNKTSVSIKQ